MSVHEYWCQSIFGNGKPCNCGAEPPSPQATRGAAEGPSPAFWVYIDKARMSPDIATSKGWLDKALAEVGCTNPGGAPSLDKLREGTHWNFCAHAYDVSQPCNCLPPWAAALHANGLLAEALGVPAGVDAGLRDRLIPVLYAIALGYEMGPGEYEEAKKDGPWIEYWNRQADQVIACLASSPQEHVAARPHPEEQGEATDLAARAAELIEAIKRQNGPVSPAVAMKAAKVAKALDTRSRTPSQGGANG